jgi:predicted  nucleic acid-binding Zn-ribbon protein
MGPVLHGLIKLQSVENRLRAVKSKLTRCRRSVIFQENQLRTLQNGLEAKSEEIKLTKIQIDRFELELKSRDDHIATYRARLNMAKTNKEYSAILTELNTSKADNSKIETQTLDLMRNIETDEADCAELETQIDEQKGKLDELRKSSEGKTGELEKEIAEIQVEWDQASNGMSQETLDIFNRVAETYDGEAIAYIDLQNEKAQVYTCDGCFMSLPTEIVNQLMTKDEVFRCTSCTRILALRDSENG